MRALPRRRLGVCLSDTLKFRSQTQTNSRHYRGLTATPRVNQLQGLGPMP